MAARGEVLNNQGKVIHFCSMAEESVGNVQRLGAFSTFYAHLREDAEDAIWLCMLCCDACGKQSWAYSDGR
jgi:hypothetical protein